MVIEIFVQQSPNDCKDIPNETLKTQLNILLLAEVTRAKVYIFYHSNDIPG